MENAYLLSLDSSSPFMFIFILVTFAGPAPGLALEWAAPISILFGFDVNSWIYVEILRIIVFLFLFQKKNLQYVEEINIFLLILFNSFSYC